MKQEQVRQKGVFKYQTEKKELQESKAVITEIQNTTNTGWNFLECLLKIEQKIMNRGFDNEREREKTNEMRGAVRKFHHSMTSFIKKQQERER